MKQIEEIDTNFQSHCPQEYDHISWHSIQQSAFQIYGLYHPDLKKNPPEFHRMPLAAAEDIHSSLAQLATNTAGGRIRFTSDSDCVALQYSCRNRCIMPHMTAIGSMGFDLYVTDGDQSIFHGSFSPGWDLPKNGNRFLSIVRFGSQEKRDITIYFPLYNDVTDIEIGLKEGALLAPGGSYRSIKPIVYYGSSITQGGCASRPGNCYQGFVQRALNVDYINLGFSGCAKGEPQMARYIANLQMSAFVMDYDHNAATAEDLLKTHAPFYRIIREAQPDLPILCISRPSDFPTPSIIHETAAIVRDTVLQAQASGDRKIYFLDGRTLFGSDIPEDCTVDGIHPNDLGFYRMGKCIASELRKILNL